MSDIFTTATQNWVEKVVIGLNLCPFAKREWVHNSVRVSVSEVNDVEQLLHALVVELALLSRQPEIETTLLVHPHVLQDFGEYNQFLDFADSLLEQMSLDGTYQVASFHPDYQFAGTAAGDVENYTNRSPYPMLHILRESSLEQAINAHPDTGNIPVNNVSLLKQLGQQHMQDLLDECHR